MMRHKFHAIPTTVEGIRFASKKESRYYAELLLAQKSGDLLFVLRQVAFDLPGRVVYRCDFLEFWKDGEVRFVDVKGYFTREAKNKIKQVEALYPVKILIV